VQSKKINEVQIRSWEPKNMKKRDSYPIYRDWCDGDKLKIRLILKNTYSKFDYNI